MTTAQKLEKLDRLKHRNCDRWGHCKPTKEEEREHHIIVELTVWLALAAAALWLLAMFGTVKP